MESQGILIQAHTTTNYWSQNSCNHFLFRYLVIFFFYFLVVIFIILKLVYSKIDLFLNIQFYEL